MSKHTPEPWVADDRHDFETNFYSDDATGSIIGGCQEYMFAHRDIEERRANARRIVTCVNACAGMADPAAEIAELKRQRDELLAAIEELLHTSSSPYSGEPEVDADLEYRYRAACARAVDAINKGSAA